MTSLEKSILATVAYYDIFDFPLTGFEIWRYLIASGKLENKKFSAGKIFAALGESENLKSKICQSRGFCTFAGREEIVGKRLMRKKLADEKWKKMRKYFQVMNAVPFLRGIFVSGSLAMENSRDDSDVDVIVVAKYGRIWTVRTFITVLAAVLGIRRHGDKTENRICLNHYVTDASLRIPFESLYNAENYAHLVNLYREDEKFFRRFGKENGWMEKYLANRKTPEISGARSMEKNKIFLSFSKFLELCLAGFLGNRLEKIFAAAEAGRIKKSRLYKKSGGRISVDDKQLEFHPDSHENFVIPEFNRRMEKMGLEEFARQKNSGLNA